MGADPSNAAPSRALPAAPAQRVLTFVRGEIQYGARVVFDAHFVSPPREARLRRLLFGFALPFGVLAATLRTPAVRARYLRVTAIQIAVLLPTGIFFLFESEPITRALEDAGGSPLSATLAVIATIVSTLSVIEWIIIALSRQYHELLGAMAAATTGAAWDPHLAPPRIALDLPWLWQKLRRRVRGVLLFASGIPLLALLRLAPFGGRTLYAVGTTLWACYWVSVFTLANTRRAWESTSTAGPWFVRAAEAVGTIPVLGAPMRWYGRTWRRVTTSVHAACASFEQAPYEAAGLAAARAISSLPCIYLFVRPVLGVAAAHALGVADANDPARALAPPPPALPGSMA